MSDRSVDLTGARILIIDDMPATLSVMRQDLETAGFDVLVATDGAMGLNIATRAVPDLIVLDVLMPDMDGFETCRRLKAEPATQDIPVLFLSIVDETGEIVKGYEMGGVDYVVKPFQEEELLARVRTHLENARLTQALTEKNRALEAEISRRQAVAKERNRLAGRLSMISQHEAEHWGVAGFVGRSPTMQRIFEEIDLLQQTPATSVLITGESGTGKELIARALHFGGPQADGPFVPVNCPAVPIELAESLLFGHVRGAFTGADTKRIGCFELAHGGTLFLDEIGAMPLKLQPKLLRVLEDGRLLPVGGTEEKVVDVRVVAATNAELQSEMAAGRFRQDLYFRLARFLVEVPPLRAHKEDLPPLVEHFLTLFAREMNLEPPVLSTTALETLEGYDFPGNVRELKNIIERALIHSRGADIQPEHLQFVSVIPSTPAPFPPVAGGPEALPLNLDEAALSVIERALAQTKGNVAAAARLLGTSRTRIYRVLEKEKQDLLQG